MKKFSKNDPVNVAIMENEKGASDWVLNDLAWDLDWWVDFFNLFFFKNEQVPVPALSFADTNVRVLGHYVIGRNAFGLRDNININRQHLNLPYWVTLSTLLHEMCHSWEYLWVDENKRTKSWYHTKAFREKMFSFGIYCNNKGQHEGFFASGLFVSLLSQHAIDFSTIYKGIPNEDQSDAIEHEPQPKPKGHSTLKKWTCGCTFVRVGKKEFAAQCLKCGRRFQLAA